MAERTPPPPDECANCGAAIPRDARSCPECGADERTGWRENDATRYDGLDLPESAFADDSHPASSTSSANRAPRSPRVNGLPWYWWCVALAILAALLLTLLPHS